MFKKPKFNTDKLEAWLREVVDTVVSHFDLRGENEQILCPYDYDYIAGEATETFHKVMEGMLKEAIIESVKKNKKRRKGERMLGLNRLQSDVKDWSYKNFGDQGYTKPLLGVVEEVGELCHAVLKNQQGIRDMENATAAVKDAVGDIIIYLCDFCARYGVSIESSVKMAWDEVAKRDWNKFPKNGRTE